MSTALSIECENGQIYAKIIKKTTGWAKEESFTISAGETVAYTSPLLVNNQNRELEVCLPSTTNSIYTLTMKDTGNDSWNDRAWIMIKDVNDILAIKYVMTAKSVETVNFSLYVPITKDEEWKFSSSFANAWNQVSFADSAWTAITCGSTTQEVAGTQYFRKTFTGVTGMAAIDVRFKYAFGVVAYINGVEIFRDNMLAGEVSQSTSASGSYATSDYHGVIRPASVAEASQSVLAVELHFTDAASRAIDFNAFLSFKVGISAENNCFMYYGDITASGDSITNPDSAFDYSRSAGAYIQTSKLPKNVFASFDPSVYPIMNAFRIWTTSSTNNSPSAFDIAGGDSSAATIWTPLASTSGQTYSSYEWRQFNLIAEPAIYKTVKVTLNASSGTSTYLYEMQFLTCNDANPTVSYPSSSYSFNARYDIVDLSVNVYGMTSCQISPQLPNGINFDTTTCHISGTALVGAPQTTYTVTASAGSRSASGTVTITFAECQGTLLRIIRTYQYSGSIEAFRIRNTATEELLMEVPIGHTNPANTDVANTICISAERYDITLDCSGSYWYSGSYIYVYAILAGDESELILKARFDGNQNNDNTYYLRRHTINVMDEWYYKMGVLPENWYDDNTSGWSQGHLGSFPASTNQIQLYKKTFNVDDISTVSGYIVSTRYKYGCVIYLNGHEAYRNHMGTGAISASTTAPESYASPSYHTATLPGRFVNEDGSNPIELLKQGTNTIAFAMFTRSASLTSADFDASVRLMTNQPEAHIWEFTGTINAITGSISNAFDGYYDTNIRYTTCSSNMLTIQLSNDRREWVNTVQIQNDYEGKDAGAAQFNLYGRNGNQLTWTRLVQVTGLTYSVPGQKRKAYFISQVPYNQFKFENFATGDSNECAWKVQSLNLYATNILVEPSPLTYPASTEIFKGIEMSELIPEGEGYYGFSITPELPQGLKFDSSNGWVSGTYNDIMNPTTYTVTAHKITGGTTTATFSLSSVHCTGGRGLMTVRIRADGFPNENSWKLFQGRGAAGTVLKSVGAFPIASTYYYLDFCLNDGLYTFEATDSYGDGWSINSGYTLTVDVGEMELEMEEVYGNGQGTPRVVSTVFSTFFPFQVEFTDWKVYQGESVAAGWNGVDFDDAAWETKKAAEIANPSVVTTYIRKSFQLTNVDDYQVLNVRMKYAGGVAVYFNGNRVARFNLIDEFDANTESIEVHDATVFSKFHIILVTAGVQEGTNVIAFEVHRPVGTSSSEAFVFDATGVFGVETCSTVVDSYSALESTTPTSGSLAGIMDLDPYTTGTLPSGAQTFVEWTVENLEGSKWNSFNLVGANDVSSWVFELYGYMNPSDEASRTTLINHDASLLSRTKPQISIPVSLAGFRKIRYEILEASTSNNVGAIFTAYCKASGAVCPGVDSFPAVGEGQISPGSCGEGFSGYSYRTCTNGILGEIQTDMCTYKTPSNIRYKSTRFTFVMGTASTTDKPTYRNIVRKWHVDDGVELPAGLTLNQETGEISGVPTDVLDMKSFTIYAENRDSVGMVTVEIIVRKGRCNAEGVFPLTEVDQVAVYECSMQGNYVGTQKRSCVLGETDGVWENASGFCMSVGTIALLIVIVIIVIAVVILILLRRGRKSKAVGGVKGKKTVKTAAKEEKKTKSVIV